MGFSTNYNLTRIGETVIVTILSRPHISKKVSQTSCYFAILQKMLLHPLVKANTLRNPKKKWLFHAHWWRVVKHAFKKFAVWNTARLLKYKCLFFKVMHQRVKDSYYLLQAQQEKLYHEYASSKHKESRDKLEHYYEQLVNKLQAEIKCILLLLCWYSGF